jgi:hypothetical protein
MLASRFILLATRFNQDPERCKVLTEDPPHFCFRSAEVTRLRKLYPDASGSQSCCGPLIILSLRP